jgi:hypothetical protein
MGVGLPDLNHYEKEIKGAYDGSTVRLVSMDTAAHLNVLVKHEGKYADNLGLTLSTEGAKELRDALTALYPPEPEKYPYEVRKRAMIKYAPGNCADGLSYDWVVFQKEPTTTDKVVATTGTEEQAKRIAQALNEAEGL